MTTLKLEVGKSYRTRDGERVEIIRYDSKHFYNGICYPYRGDNTFTYQEDGLIINEDTDPDDLISEWQDEPTTVTYTQADVEPLVDVVEKMAWLYGPTDGLTPIIDIGKMCREALTKFQKARGE